jgi:C_GCAxxG_C_C family probable redox protein
LDIHSDLVPRIASAFAGGMGGTGSVCGALTGAVMAIGLRHGRDNPAEPDTRAHALTQEIRRRFETEMGHIECRRITGMDLSTREGIKRFVQSDVPGKVCLPAVGVAYDTVIELLDDPKVASDWRQTKEETHD